MKFISWYLNPPGCLFRNISVGNIRFPLSAASNLRSVFSLTRVRATIYVANKIFCHLLGPPFGIPFPPLYGSLFFLSLFLRIPFSLLKILFTFGFSHWGRYWMVTAVSGAIYIKKCNTYTFTAVWLQTVGELLSGDTMHTSWLVVLHM